MIFLRSLWPFDHVLNIMLCFSCPFVLMYDIGIKFDMIFLQKSVNLERKTQHAVITYTNTTNGMRIPTFWKRVGEMMLYLSNASLSVHHS